MKYDVIVVGGGIAGLTSTAYLCKSGLKVLLCEKEETLGGLVTSFDYKGFRFDGGIRAIENSGMVHPMLRELGINLEFLENKVSLGIGNEVIWLKSRESLKLYGEILKKEFKDNTSDIDKIIKEIEKIMKYMDILYGVDNPLFLDFKKDREYFIKKVAPWSFKFLAAINKINRLNTPVYEYLEKFTENKALIDVIAQHFFKNTPTFFALGYFGLYLDYKYPKGGTSSLPKALEDFILEHKGEIKRETEIIGVNPEKKTIKDSKGNEYEYGSLIWAGDLKKLYRGINEDLIKGKKLSYRIENRRRELEEKCGGDSVLTIYVTLDLDKSYFEERCSEHFFYTPNKKGVSSVKIGEDENYLRSFYREDTYEISIPVMRDDSLAPKGKTGLIISTLMDYELVKNIREDGWYEGFKEFSSECILNVLNESIFKGIKEKVIDSFVATPLTIERRTGTSNGAITGWAFTGGGAPVEKNMARVARSVKTEIPNVFVAGQWTFSPAGLPVAILTGKLAASRVIKKRKKSKG